MRARPAPGGADGERHQEAGDVPGGREVAEGDLPVQDRGVEDEAGDPVAHPESAAARRAIDAPGPQPCRTTFCAPRRTA